MMGKSKRNPELFIVALATGATISEASKKAGVHRNTGQKWADKYAEEIANRRADLVAESLDKMRGLLNQSVDVLSGLLMSQCERTRLAAAKAIFGQFCKLQDQVEFEERLTAIEEQQKYVA